MITLKKIKIYKKYSGDIDGWARTGKNSELKLMTDEDWVLIDELIQNLELIKNGVASKDFEMQTIMKLQESCENERTQKELKSMIGKFI